MCSKTARRRHRDGCGIKSCPSELPNRLPSRICLGDSALVGKFSEKQSGFIYRRGSEASERS